MKNSPDYSTVSKKWFIMTNGVVPTLRFTRSGGLAGMISDVAIENGGFYFLGTEHDLDKMLQAEWDEHKQSRFKVLGIYECDDAIVRLTRKDLTEKAFTQPFDKISLFSFRSDKVNKEVVAKATEIIFEDDNGRRKDLIKKKEPSPEEQQCPHSIINENDEEWFCESGCGKIWSKQIYH